MNNIWQTFVGGSYKNRQRFIQEMQEYGFSRRIPANTARGFNFGDKIVFLRYMQKRVQSFATGEINSIIFNKDLSDKVAEVIRENYEVTYNPAPMQVNRECGDYQVQGNYEVKNITLPEIVKIAQSLSPDEPVFCMVGGDFLGEIRPPGWIEPAPKFTRGFIKVGEGKPVSRQKGKITAIDQYRRK